MPLKQIPDNQNSTTLEKVSKQETQLEMVGKEVWNTRINLDQKSTKIKHILHSQLANFPDYIQKTSGKIIQINITVSETEILIRVFSFNGATQESVQQKFEEFANFSGAENLQDAMKFVTYSDNISSGNRLNYELICGMQKQSFDFNMKIVEKFENITIQANEFANILLNKITSQSTTLNFQNNQGNINLGDNSTISQNQSEFIEQILKIADVLAETKKSELPPSQLHYIQELEQDIKILKSNQLDKNQTESWLEKVEKYISVTGSLVTLSEKISPIITIIYSLLKIK